MCPRSIFQLDRSASSPDAMINTCREVIQSRHKLLNSPWTIYSPQLKIVTIIISLSYLNLSLFKAQKDRESSITKCLWNQDRAGLRLGVQLRPPQWVAGLQRHDPSSSLPPSMDAGRKLAGARDQRQALKHGVQASSPTDQTLYPLTFAPPLNMLHQNGRRARCGSTSCVSKPLGEARWSLRENNDTFLGEWECWGDRSKNSKCNAC